MYQRSDMLRSEVLTKEDLLIAVISDSDFLSIESPWEIIFSKATGVRSREYREHLLNIMEHRQIPDVRKRWYIHRWTRCLFDSISPKYFLMTEVYVPTSLSLELMQPFLKEEELGYNDLGRHDVTYLDLSRMTWGLSGNSHLIREKLHGVHMERVQRPNGFTQWRMLGYTMPVTTLSGELFEWTASGVFCLFPYGLPDHRVNSIEVRDHKWETPTPQAIASYEEGVMILQGTKEVRLKRIPTIETSFGNEIWETGLDSTGLFRIRPRYGRAAIRAEFLDYLPTMQDLEVPHLSFTVNYTSTGPYVGKTVVDDLIYTIDSGYRVHSGCLRHIDAGLPAEQVQDVLHVEKVYYYTLNGDVNAGPVVAPIRSRAGVKAVIFNEANEMFLIKDGGKPYDYVGGSVSFGESTVDCLIREVWEETGSRVTAEDLVYVGLSTSHESSGNWHSYIYLIPSLKIDMRKFCKISKALELDDYQPWVRRIMLTVGNMIGNACVEYFLSHTRVSLEFPTRRQLKVVESVVGHILRERKYYTGPDLMHGIYKCAQVDAVDFSVLKVILSHDFRVSPYINVMCDHSDVSCECTYVLHFQGERSVIRSLEIVRDMVAWMAFVSNTFCISNGVPKRRDIPGINMTVTQWALKDPDKEYYMTDQPAEATCHGCGQYQKFAYWFVRTKNRGTFCPKCYIRVSHTVPRPIVVKTEPGPGWTTVVSRRKR